MSSSSDSDSSFFSSFFSAGAACAAGAAATGAATAANLLGSYSEKKQSRSITNRFQENFFKKEISYENICIRTATVVGSTISSSTAGTSSSFGSVHHFYQTKVGGQLLLNTFHTLRNSLTVVASLNSTSVTAAIANRFLNPLTMLCGAEATVG